MKSTQELTDNPDHIKNYRPKVLVLTGQSHYLLLSTNPRFMKLSFEDIKHSNICSGNPAHRPSLVDFANVITKKLSLLICGHVSHQEGAVNIANLKEGMQAWLKDHQIAGYYSFVQHATLSGGMFFMYLLCLIDEY